MNIPEALLESQKFSDKTLRGFLLKNIDLQTQNTAVKELNYHMVQRVDQFWNDVVVPLRSEEAFDGNKINWYFEVYKEGLEARKLQDNPFTYIEVTDQQIKDLVSFYQGKTLGQYLALGTSYLSNSYTLLSSWLRDQMVVLRLEHVYKSDKPHEWIKCAETEADNVLYQKPATVDGLDDVIRNIGLIMSRRY